MPNRFVVCCTVILLVSACSVLSQTSDDPPIPQHPKVLKPEDAVKADTSLKPVKIIEDSLPGGSPSNAYHPLQDTNYFRAMRLRIPNGVRFTLDAKRTLTNIEMVRRAQQETPWQIAMRNMQVPEQAYTPDPRENVQHQLAIQNSMAAPLFKPAQIAGMSVTLGQIASVLGLAEDVTPRVQFTLPEVTTVTVVVYSTNAMVVRTILTKSLQPGRYEITWDGFNDNGKLLPDGDYVIEARLGEGSSVRKRCVLGATN
ncbi:MAG: hypothetical protein JNJ85_03975 [Candidatus Kapabacteria bacterium]|nr:hypothetical protein [Candidatus Kapabacteria bacterium]